MFSFHEDLEYLSVLKIPKMVFYLWNKKLIMKMLLKDSIIPLFQQRMILSFSNFSMNQHKNLYCYYYYDF